MTGAQIDYNRMRIRTTFLCAPIGGFLKVESLVGRAVDVSHVFAVGILHNPRLAGQTATILVQEIHFGNTSQVFSIL